MGWLITLAVIICVFLIPLGIDGLYDNSGANVSLVAGPIRILLYPKKKKTSKKTRTKEENKPVPKRTAAPQPSVESGGSYKDFQPIVPIALDFLGCFRTKLRANLLEINLILGGGDPCDLAVNYGKGWAVLGNLIPQLERLFVIKKRKLQVQCDFTAENTTVYAHIILTITVGQLLYVGLFYGVRFLYHYFKIINQRKGGANT